MKSPIPIMMLVNTLQLSVLVFIQSSKKRRWMRTEIKKDFCIYAYSGHIQKEKMREKGDLCKAEVVAQW